MLQVEMTASVRTVTGKGPMRQLRMSGFTPGVVYGPSSDALAIQLETRSFFQQLLNIYGRNAVVTLQLDNGTTKHVLVQDIQTDPIKDTLIHVDFFEIDIAKSRRFHVPISYQGNAKGCDLGGVLHIAKDNITVQGTPVDIPDEFVLDISPLKIGDRIRVNEISIPANIELLEKPEAVCVSVVLGKKDIEAEAGVEESSAA